MTSYEPGPLPPLPLDYDGQDEHIASFYDASQMRAYASIYAAQEVARVTAGSAEQREDAIEAAYWEFDARRKGYGKWKGQPQSERDAFKWTVRALGAIATPSAESDARDAAKGKA